VTVELSLAPGSVVEVRDEEWLVTSAEQGPDGWKIEVQGLTELVRDTTATFFDALDDVVPLDPRDARIVGDDSPRYRRTRLWLEATLRKTPVPQGQTTLAVAHKMLADPLRYQRRAVSQALSRDNLRPRLLIADAVGLGKTLEIGMIISELARRGRADRILVVSPAHVLGQMQHELWCRFAIPLVRLDSEGIQRVRQQLPSSRNPFTYFKRVIISIDTLKSARYRAHLERQRWDVVVIDESHNLTNTGTMNNELARVLAPNTETLLLASATPHNGKKESFAELLRLLDPTAVSPEGDFTAADAHRLFIRRHRHSTEVADEVGADWAERAEPVILAVAPSPAEDAIADELAHVWLYPEDRESPYSGRASALFPWTLAKAFLSSPAALSATVRERAKRIDTDSQAGQREGEALDRLAQLADEALVTDSGKLTTLVGYLKQIGIGARSEIRVVLFAERIATLDWLRDRLPALLGMPETRFAVLHGGLPDVDQQRIVEDFKLHSSDVRVLITGDVASEGVNLHAQCHHLVHVDIPWSLIRIEQRNGRIDRYGQQHSPQITALALTPSDAKFSGDVRVLERLLTKEHEAHTTLGDAASLMGRHGVAAEEDAIRSALAQHADLDSVVPDVDKVLDRADALAFLDALFVAPDLREQVPEVDDEYVLYREDVTFLAEALAESYGDPARSANNGGVGWQTFPAQGLVQLEPPADLRSRLSALPQAYLADRRVKEKLILATTYQVGREQLRAARECQGGTIWPEAHFLSPLHPVLDWAADKVLTRLGRNEVFAVHGNVSHPTVLLLGTLMNRRGQVVTSQFVTVEFPTGAADLPIPTAQSNLDFLDETGLRAGGVNPGPVSVTSELEALVPAAVDSASAPLDLAQRAQIEDLNTRLDEWRTRARQWQQGAEQLERFGAAKGRLTRLSRRVSEEQDVAESLAPSQRLVRPLLVIVPEETRS
jgi:superfamily II DNA or RNA helicase